MAFFNLYPPTDSSSKAIPYFKIGNRLQRKQEICTFAADLPPGARKSPLCDGELSELFNT